ncbi:hypothetical protein HYV10_01605 [Candidatus Dependentiae bacterium]|nr:hypothetical protein [Candidatus Dependentiae bacterium]
MPKYKETAVKTVYPALKDNKDLKPYWCDTPSSWIPSHTFFWNVILK